MNNKSNELLELLKKDESLRREVIHALARDYPREFLSRVKLEPNRIRDALADVVVSCKEWQE
jgi:hypothetical protein